MAPICLSTLHAASFKLDYAHEIFFLEHFRCEPLLFEVLRHVLIDWLPGSRPDFVLDVQTNKYKAQNLLLLRLREWLDIARLLRRFEASR